LHPADAGSDAHLGCPVQSIIRILATGPEELLNLSRYLYSSWHIVFPMVPLNSQFLWLNLGSPDKFLIMPILVAGTMWIQQKNDNTQNTDPQQQHRVR